MMTLEDLVEMILQHFVFPRTRKAWVVFVSAGDALPCRVICAINIYNWIFLSLESQLKFI